jgi:hypothetical protein
VSDRQFSVTFFQSFAASSKEEQKGTLAELGQYIATTHAPTKERLPWLKLAGFGDNRTTKNSLRHDANVKWVSGIEADYDGEQMSFNEAFDILEDNGITALLYTSPSHEEAKPRWRVLCPFKLGRIPEKRSHYLARLNGIFGGIFSHESWTLSQSYYFGAIDGNPAPRVAQVHGHTIDQLDYLDFGAIGRPAGASKATSSTTGNHPGTRSRDDSELIRRVITGEGYHCEMCALAARYCGSGMKPDGVAEVLRGLMLSTPEAARDDRWHQRFGQIPDLVTSASAKFTDQVEARRAVARVTHKARRAGLPSTEIKAAVLAEAERGSVDTDTALRIARRILAEEIRHAA